MPRCALGDFRRFGGGMWQGWFQSDPPSLFSCNHCGCWPLDLEIFWTLQCIFFKSIHWKLIVTWMNVVHADVPFLAGILAENEKHARIRCGWRRWMRIFLPNRWHDFPYWRSYFGAQGAALSTHSGSHSELDPHAIGDASAISHSLMFENNILSHGKSQCSVKQTSQ